MIGPEKNTVLRFAIRMLAGLLPAFAFGAYARWPELAFLAYVTLVPWIILYTDDRHPRVSHVYYFVGAYFSWILLYPQSFRYGALTPFLMALTMIPPWLVFSPVLRSVHHRLRLPRTVTVPVLWVAVEWLRATFTLAHFDLYRLGGSQARFAVLIQIVDVVGVYGLTFLVVAVNALAVDILFELRDRGWSLARALRARRILFGFAFVAACFTVAVSYGLYRLGTARQVEGPRIALVQPNELHTIRNTLGVHLSQVALTDRNVGRGEADLIVWPENAIMDDIYRQGAYLDDLAWLVESKDASLLLGALRFPAEHPGKTTNAAFLLDRHGSIRSSYDKQLLFPWGEYVPLDGLMERTAPGIQRTHRMLTRKGWGFLPTGVPGNQMKLFSLPWRGSDVPFATLICNENTYPPYPAEAGRLGARMLINITSEGEVGGPVQEQLLRGCILRSVENRIPYVRVGNTGISCVIDAQGSVHRVLRGANGGTIGERGVLIEAVRLSPPAGATLYARSHDAFAKVCVVTTVLLLIWGALRRRRAAAALTTAALLVSGQGCFPVPEVGSGNQAAAEAALERGLQAYKSQPPAIREAIRELAAACADPDACEKAIPYIAQCFLAERQMEVAAEFFADVWERHPELEALARGYRGFFLNKTMNVHDAVVELEASLAAEPSPRVYGWLGKIERRMGHRPEAIELFRAGLLMAPSRVDLRFLLADSLWQDGRPEEADKEIGAVLDARPDHGSAWVTFGRIRTALGDESAAAPAYRRAIEVDPDNLEARYLLARIAIREGRQRDFDELLEQIQQIEATLGRGRAEE